MSIYTVSKSRSHQNSLVHLCCDLEPDLVLSGTTGHKAARFIGQKHSNAVAVHL